MKRLETKIQTRIEKLCEAGDKFAEIGNYSFALKNYWTAYDYLPYPKEDWVAGTWILSAIGDSNFLNKEYQAGIDNLTSAMVFPNAIENPFIHLRLGQCYYEIGNIEKAAKEFLKVYALEGEHLLSEEDPKYLNSIKYFLLTEEIN